MENSYNTILEITLRQHEPILTTINNLYKNNFNIYLSILAVKKEFSTLGINQRYEFQKQTQGYARWTTQQAHDASYDNMPQTISLIERSPFLSSISIYDRNNNIIYNNQRSSTGKWLQSIGSATQTLLNYRNKPLTQEDKDLLISSWCELKSKKYNRKAPKYEIEIIENNIHELKINKNIYRPSLRPKM
jgi:hypothetical protein